jgi:signal transduction histidine kinase
MGKINFFFVFILLATTTFAQKMNIGASQADFRFLVSGLKRIDGKYVPVGLQRYPESMDSLIRTLKRQFSIELKKKPASDSVQLVLLERLSYCYAQHPSYKKLNYADSVLSYEYKKLVIARKIQERDIADRAYSNIWLQYQLAKKPTPVKVKLLNDWINEYNAWINDEKSELQRNSPYLILASLYEGNNDEESAEKTVIKMLDETKTRQDRWWSNRWLGFFYFRHENKDKAIKYLNEVIATQPPISVYDFAASLASAAFLLAQLKIEKNEFDEALALIPHLNIANKCNNCRGSLSSAVTEDLEYRTNTLNAEVLLAKKEPAKALPFLQKIPKMINNENIQKISNPKFEKLWYQYYLQIKDYPQALFFLEKYLAVLDSTQKVNKTRAATIRKNNIDVERNYEALLSKEKADQEKLLQEQRFFTLEKQNEIEKIKAEADKKSLASRAEKAELQRKIETTTLQANAKKKKQEQDFKISRLNEAMDVQRRTRSFLLIGLGLFVLFASLLFTQNRQKQKANALLKKQRDEINLQRDKAESTLHELKSTQAQLIQSEKLASLGELTAGIAHEIQNPLNFVNNFSELSVELAEELKEEISKPELDKGLIEELAADLATNQEKINHHGKRASAIVKGMLEHSRMGDAMNRVSTDINALADEYLRLAYHGLRAKDSSFNAAMETHFDPDLPKIEVIPQDIGRVLLNLINNAFFAINDKSKQGIEGYSPTVTISTRLRLCSATESAIEIKVQDNGNGIPEAIKDKIFQPFFTTKPTGQGTGLGLSLAYDIVTKGHGGSLEVESKETGTLFIIRFPA